MAKKELSEQDYWLGLSLFEGIGLKRLQIIKKKFGLVKNFWTAKNTDIKISGLPYSIAQRFINFRQKTDIFSYKIRLEKSLVKFITLEDKKYPKLLTQIPNPPPVLYYRGDLLTQDGLSLAVIGTRRPTLYGRQVTQQLTTDLVQYGFTIVSGLARGIDSIAHRVALGQKGRTIAVLGSGLDQIYPPEHRGLAEQIANQGAVVTEYPLGQKPSPRQFPARNRIISGLSLGILITEGASKSGTKNTAAFAADQGREVFCVPGPIMSPLSSGPADLIKVGAKLTTSVTDILDELQYQHLIPAKKKSVKKITFHSQKEEELWRTLIGGSKTTDQLVRLMKLTPSQIHLIITDLELRGLVKNIGSGQYMAVSAS